MPKKDFHDDDELDLSEEELEVELTGERLKGWSERGSQPSEADQQRSGTLARKGGESEGVLVMAPVMIEENYLELESGPEFKGGDLGSMTQRFSAAEEEEPAEEEEGSESASLGGAEDDLGGIDLEGYELPDGPPSLRAALGPQGGERELDGPPTVKTPVRGEDILPEGPSTLKIPTLSLQDMDMDWGMALDGQGREEASLPDQGNKPLAQSSPEAAEEGDSSERITLPLSRRRIKEEAREAERDSKRGRTAPSLDSKTVAKDSKKDDGLFISETDWAAALGGFASLEEDSPLDMRPKAHPLPPPPPEETSALDSPDEELELELEEEALEQEEAKANGSTRPPPLPAARKAGQGEDEGEEAADEVFFPLEEDFKSSAIKSAALIRQLYRQGEDAPPPPPSEEGDLEDIARELLEADEDQVEVDTEVFQDSGTDLKDIVQELIRLETARHRQAEVEREKLRNRTKKKKPWFEEIFDKDYLLTVPAISELAIYRETRFILDSLGLDRGNRILDLCCGPGRYSVEMTRLGYQVVGLDLSRTFIRLATERAKEEGLQLEFIHGDMRKLAFHEVFDGVVNYYTSFGYFDDDTNFQVLQSIHRSLKKKGRFLIDVINRDYVVSEMPMRLWWEGRGCVLLEEVEFDFRASQLRTKRTIILDEGRQRDQEIVLRVYSLHELCQLLQKAGFEIVEVSGGVACRGTFFGSDSQRIVVVAEKA